MLGWNDLTHLQISDKLIVFSSGAWVIGARGGLQFCHPKSREMPAAPLLPHFCRFYRHFCRYHSHFAVITTIFAAPPDCRRRRYRTSAPRYATGVDSIYFCASNWSHIATDLVVLVLLEFFFRWATVCKCRFKSDQGEYGTIVLQANLYASIDGDGDDISDITSFFQDSGHDLISRPPAIRCCIWSFYFLNFRCWPSTLFEDDTRWRRVTSASRLLYKLTVTTYLN